MDFESQLVVSVLGATPEDSELFGKPVAELEPGVYDETCLS